MKTVLTFLLASTFISSAAAAQATAETGESQGGLEEIVVTAQRRGENLQKTPIAISALTSADLVERNIVSVSDLATAIPSVNSRPFLGSNAVRTLYIRGQGSGNPGDVLNDGGVGQYIDGFYLARPQAAEFDIGEVERIEVLRGPQGTLYGRNTTGGAINVITRKPSGELGARAEGGIGNFDYWRIKTSIDLPTWNNFSVLLSFLASHKDGFVKNSGAGPDSTNPGLNSQIGGRAAVRWTPFETVTIDYGFDRISTRTTPPYFVNPVLVGVLPGYDGDPYRTYRPITVPKSKADSESHSFTVAVDLSDSIVLKSLTGWRRLDNDNISDLFEAFGTPLTAAVDYRARAFTQELQLNGSALDNALTFNLGAFYFNERIFKDSNISNGVPAGVFGPMPVTLAINQVIVTRTKSYALYGQATLRPARFDGRVGITGGLRYTRDEREALRDTTITALLAPGVTVPISSELGARYEQRFNNISPSATVDFQINPRVNAYAKFSKAYKAGSTSDGGPIFSQGYDPEKVTSYEIGLKSDLLDRRLRVNIAAFLNRFKDLQVGIAPDLARTDQIQTVNAGRADVKGIELDVTAVPHEDVTITLSYAYLDAKVKSLAVPANTIFDPTVNPASPYNIGDDISDLFDIPFTPKHAITLSGAWTFLHIGDSDLNIRADYNFRDKTPVSTSAGPGLPGFRNAITPDYSALDARLTYNTQMFGNKASIALFTTNILNSRYRSSVVGFGNGYTGYVGQIYTPSEPRAYGLQLDFTF